MQFEELIKRLVPWADGVSFLLLGFMYLMLPLPPSQRVWPRDGELWVWHSIIIVNCAWNGFRFFAEAWVDKTGPRGFMQMSVVYCAVWIYTLNYGWNQDHIIFQRRRRVLRAVRLVQQLRLGKSTRRFPARDKDKIFGHDRKDAPEVVVRRGVARDMWPRLLSRRIVRYTSHEKKDRTWKIETSTGVVRWRVCSLYPEDKGGRYWRGEEELVQRWKPVSGGNWVAWKVDLVEQEMHMSQLGPFFKPGESGYRRKQDFFKSIYDTVYQSFRTMPDHQFLREKWTHGEGLAESLAEEADCKDNNCLGGIARKIAGDACYFVYNTSGDAQFRTEQHVYDLNQIVQGAAKYEAEELAQGRGHYYKHPS